MGVPKFFRWISERYPCLSELVKEYQIPDFDNLYLDMNGIIHTCSHPNDFDPHFRITEEKIFKDIFHYIEILFRMIQPQQVFFMAVDGVAPRAKQNQQRGRRFRSAKEAEMLELKAKEKGESLPDAKRFDSNCITPGTPFMVRLQEQLKFFVAYKISTDELWQKCKIILSGHETPGEGEHKIMDYIRYIKAQPDYDANTRHCLYGLDADLVMLGLCSHEPHFSLLREEVRFDRKNQQRVSTPEETTFFLLHLSLMREYLEHEFSDVKKKLPEGFAFDLEAIIDDWVLMGFLVGNDFIPPLPEMHINTGALPILYKTYMDVLPRLGGYINEGGTLNLGRFQTYMEELAKFDVEQFDDKFADLQYFQAKTGRRPNEKSRTNYGKMSASDMEQLIAFTFDHDTPVKPPVSKDLEALIQSTNDDLEALSTEGEEEVEEEGEVEETLMMAEFRQHKKDYYMNKLNYRQVTSSVLRSQAEGYVRAIQWNLNYYYNGVCSWSWYYPHHYAPFISDIKDFGDMKLEFDMGQPFLPFQQLLAVLPAASKDLLPEAYQWLMVSPESPIISFYPTEFETDLNGKKQEWEAVVLIPFIEETALLAAMDTCTDRLLPDEVARNGHGPMSVYTHTIEDSGPCVAPDYFPVLVHNHASLELVRREDIYVERDKLVKGLCPGTRLDVFFPGFPTLKHLQHKASLGKGKVKVFEQPSRGDNMVLTISATTQPLLKDVATHLLGQVIYAQWPHLTEAMVTCVCTKDERYELVDGKPVATPMSGPDSSMWQQSRKAIAENYMGRRGVQVGETTILVKALSMIGRKYTFGSQTKITLEKQWAVVPSSYALQAVVKDITVHDPTFVQYKTLEEVFPLGSHCFMLAGNRYGHMGEVVDGGTSGRVKLKVVETADPDLTESKHAMRTSRTTYMQGGAAAARLGISSHLLSRVTGNIFVQPIASFESSNSYKSNIGLSLKYTKKNEEIPGYTRRDANGSNWLYSQRAVELVDSYMETFPDLFEYLCTHTGNDDFNEEDIFPGEVGSVAAISAWLKTQEYTRVERQPCGSSIMEKEVVLTIEKAMDVDTRTEQRCHLQVKPYLLYKPELHTGNLPPDLTAVYTLFDRVVNVRKCFTVPLGLKGVVTGIHKAEKEEEVLYDVVFDEPFTGGLTLNCSPNRGYRMPRNALINISHGRRLEEGVTAPTESSWYGSAFAPVDRSRPLPPARIFDNTGLNGATAYKTQVSGRSQQGSWRHKEPVPETPTYKLLTKSPRPVATDASQSDDYQAMWQSLQPTGPSAASSPAQPPKAPDASTNILKQMLGIPAAVQSGNMTQVSVQDLFKHALTKEPKDVQQGSKNYCIQLLNLFQANGLGTPRYNYFNELDTGLIRATAMLPDGQAFTGQSAPTREQASDNAARVALKRFTRPVANKLPTPPTPPQQWRQPPQQQQQHQQQATNWRSPTYSQPPFTQLPFAQSPLSQPPFAQSPLSQPPFAQSPLSQPPFAQSPFNQSPLSQQPFAQSPMSQPPFAQSPMSQPPFAQSSPFVPQQQQVALNGVPLAAPHSNLVKVTGPPPQLAPRDAPAAPRLAELPVPFTAQLQEPLKEEKKKSTSNEAAPTKKPQRIAANFKAAKKISKKSAKKTSSVVP